MPFFTNKILTRPLSGLNNVYPTLATITHDKKCGKYNIVCVTFLNFGNLSSFKRIASMIGTGNPMNKSKKLKII